MKFVYWIFFVFLCCFFFVLQELVGKNYSMNIGVDKLKSVLYFCTKLWENRISHSEKQIFFRNIFLDSENSFFKKSRWYFGVQVTSENVSFCGHSLVKIAHEKNKAIVIFNCNRKKQEPWHSVFWARFFLAQRKNLGKQQWLRNQIFSYAIWVPRRDSLQKKNIL